jgi:hypothetical protein
MRSRSAGALFQGLREHHAIEWLARLDPRDRGERGREIDRSHAFRNAAGLFATDPISCRLDEVRAADIQGFLEKGNCFIATAAFQSPTSAPVNMLRRFRDRILMRFGAGRDFVSWYYSWSPGAADWLMSHPEYRLPVLIALLPLQVVAYFLLNPAWMLALLALGPAGAVGLYWALYRYYRNTDKSHAYERESKVETKPVTGSDQKVGTNNGTRERRIDGDNVSEYRKRVERMRKDSS